MPVPKRENLTEVFAIDQTIGMAHSTMEGTVPPPLASSFLSELIVSMHIQLFHTPDALAMAKIENLNGFRANGMNSNKKKKKPKITRNFLCDSD